MLLSKVKPRAPQGLSKENYQYRSEATDITMSANHGHLTHINSHITGPNWAQCPSLGNMTTLDKSMQTGIRLGILPPPPSLSARLGFISPEPTQILTVFQDKVQTLTIHLNLDSGANVSYMRLSEAKKRGFKVRPNGQLSILGDGLAKLASVGEVHETFHRNSWTVVFRALVVHNLSYPFIAGTTFLKDNAVTQDFNRNTISVHDRKHVVMDTKKESIMPVSPKCNMIKPAELAPLEATTRTLLPGQSISIKTTMPEGSTVLAEPWHTNSLDWPSATLCQVQQGSVELSNDTQEPIMLGKKGQVQKVKMSQTMEKNPMAAPPPSKSDYYVFNKQEVIYCDGKANLAKITFGNKVEKEVKEKLVQGHNTYSEVFNESLAGGYNGHFGPFECRLNWASEQRPPCTKLRAVNYNHSNNALLQEVMDDLTREGVMTDPHDLGITVQCICPAFLNRKRKAKDKPTELLTKKDMRLLINFGPVNDLIKDVPTTMTTVDEVFNVMGRFKHIIAFDMYNGFFQSHMSKDSLPWLGVMTPFGGLRVITRSAQGLLGMSEEFTLLVRKIIKEELQAGKVVQLVDDFYVGGETQQEAASNYLAILHKFSLANLKVAASKTHIFPKQVDVLGWLWHEGGRLEPSPHRRNSLVNTRQEDIRKVKDMRSWLGLYKTLRRATPNISGLLDALEQAVAAKESKEDFQWTHELEMRFREAKSAVKDMHTLYLPSPDDQLCMVPDGAKKTPGIGHVLYAIKDEEKVPVRFHSLKLPTQCERWQPCEVEALAFATGIEAEYDLIRESKHPLLICPDSKVVADAVQLIKKGKFSASARINSFLTNVNKVAIKVAHISGKAGLNAAGDHQSRHPSQCDSAVCSVCKFVNTMAETVLDPAARNAGAEVLPSPIMINRKSWKEAQKRDEACKTAHTYLRTGKTPPSKVGEFFCRVRQYCRDTIISPEDGLLVVPVTPKPLTGDIARERIVIPQMLLPTLLHQLHNTSAAHPTRSQQRQIFDRSYYAIEVDKHITDLYSHCYPCSVLQRLPSVAVAHESKAVVKHPHEYFHLDVIKRASQKILLLVDHFSSFQAAKLIKSEKACDLKDGILVLTGALRRPGRIVVKTDNAKGFESLHKNDPDLKDLDIELVLADVFNKNSNAVVDKGCQELEEELRKLSPEGLPISQATLSKAVLQVNQKLRRGGTLTSYEIHTARDAQSGANLRLDDEVLRDHQLDRRQSGRTTVQPAQEVKVGDLVAVKAPQDKHKARSTFVVTGKVGERVQAQRLLHTLQPGQQKIMSKVYETDAKRLIVTRRPDLPGIPPVLATPPVPPQPPPRYDAVNKRFWDSDDSDDSDVEDDPVHLQHHAPIVHREPAVEPLVAVAEVVQPVLPEAQAAAVPVGVLVAVDPVGDAEDEVLDEDQQDHAVESDLEDDEAREVGDADADVEDNDVGMDGEPHLDQSRQPRKGDVVSFREGGADGHWIEARVISACTGRNRFYYNVVTLDTAEEYGVWLKPPQITDTGHQEAWHLGGRQDFMRSPTRPPSRRVSFGSSAREEVDVSGSSLLDLTPAELTRVLSQHSL